MMQSDDLKSILAKYNVSNDKVDAFVRYYNKAIELDLNYPIYYALSKADV